LLVIVLHKEIHPFYFLLFYRKID